MQRGSLLSPRLIALLVVAAVLSAAAPIGVVATVIVLRTGGSDTESGRFFTVAAKELSRPLRLAPVIDAHPAPCETGQLPDRDSAECFSLGDGVEITSLEGLQVAQDRGGSAFHLTIKFPEKYHHTIQKLTQQLSTQAPPQNRLATVANDAVLVAPTVLQTIPGNSMQLSGNYSRAEAEAIRDTILG